MPVFFNNQYKSGDKRFITIKSLINHKGINPWFKFQKAFKNSVRLIPNMFCFSANQVGYITAIPVINNMKAVFQKM